MASLMPEKLHPFIPVEDDKFPGPVLMRGLKVGGGMKLLQYYYFSKAFCTCSYHGTTSEHLSEEKFCHIKLNEFLFLLSALIPIKGPHMAIPAHKNAFRKELRSKLPGSTENWRLTTGARHFCRATHHWCVLAKVSKEQQVGVDFSSAPSCMSWLAFLQWEVMFIRIYFNGLF